MLNRVTGALLLTGAAVMLWTVPVLFGDTTAGMQAFRKGDYQTAYREWKAAANQGQAEAQYNLGLLYLKGLGVAKDPAEAFRWLRLAADQGQANAQFQVGMMREKGVGVPQDYAQRTGSAAAITRLRAQHSRWINVDEATARLEVAQHDVQL